MTKASFQKSWNEIRDQSAQAKKKVLDKVGLIRYNIRTDDGDALVSSTSFDKERSEITKQVIQTLGDRALAAVKEVDPLLPAPIIAGGAVRDFILGVRPKDYDIFVDLSTIENDDEKDDVCLLITSKIYEGVVEDRFVATDLQIVGSDYEAGPNNTSGFICGYDSIFNGIPFQVLGRADNPEETVNKFDYDLVKAWYDTGTKLFTFTPEFQRQLVTKEIEASSEKTYFRIQRFLSRSWFGHSKFQIVKTYKDSPKKPVPFDIETISTASKHRVMFFGERNIEINGIHFE